MKLGRNDKCSCGSGLKFKKCCLLNGSKGIIEASAQRLKERSLQNSSLRGEKAPLYFHDLKGVRKMSEVILEFAEPLLDKSDGLLESQKKALSIAIVAWNIALMTDIDDQIENLENQMGSEDEQFLDDMSLTIKYLVQRKLDFYSDIRRIIMDYDIVDTREGFHLNVVSSLITGDRDSEVFENEVERIHGINKERVIHETPQHSSKTTL